MAVRLNDPIVVYPWANCMILSAIWMHYWYAWELLKSDAPLGVTALHAASAWLSVATVPVMFAVATSALVSLIIKLPWKWNFIALLPQQFLLILSFSGARHAIAVGQFPTGTDVFPREFISADQAATIIVCVMHSVAIVQIHAAGAFQYLWKSALHRA